MKRAKRIYIQQWMELKPYKRHSQSDMYYLGLCNKVYKVLTKDQFLMLRMYFDEEELQILSCFLVSYFEDVISQTNIWNTFVRKHQEMYGKKLPFYPTDEYDEGEINKQDVAFLSWYFLNTVQVAEVISPYNAFLDQLGFEVMEIFEEEYEVAPENEVLQSVYQLEESSSYYEVRKFLDVLLFQTYLFYPDTGLELEASEAEILEKYGKDITVINLLNENRDSSLHSAYTKILSLKGKDWAAELLGSKHPLHDPLKEMSERVQGRFLYKGQDRTHITLEHIASSKTFRLTKESFDHSVQLNKIDQIIFISLIKWKDEWWFSGVFFIDEYDPSLVEEEKRSPQSLRSVAFLTDQKEKMQEVLQEQKERFLEYNEGSLIAFMPAKEIQPFLNGFTSYYNQSLKLSKEEHEQARQRAKEKGYGEEEAVFDPEYEDMPEDGVVFFNPNSGVEIISGISSAFPSKQNPFYEEELNKDDVLSLLVSKDFSKELVYYCLDHYKDELTFFEEGAGQKYLNDLDFLLRFWKAESYHTTPSITLV